MVKKTTTKLANGVTLVKTNQTTRKLGLVVMSLGIFYRVSLLLSFVEKIFLQVMEQESVRGSENGECEGEESLNPGLSSFKNMNHQLKGMGATARSRQRSGGHSGIGQGTAARGGPTL